MKTIYKVGAYRIEGTMVSGLYRVRGPGIESFSGSMKNLRLLKEIAQMLASAYTTGGANLAKQF
jgi:hypothetical protein